MDGADTEDDMGSTTTGKTELEFTPEQLAAQYAGLREVEALQPLEEMQIRRALALLQPSDSVTGPARSAVTSPMRAGAGIARNAFATSLGYAGLPTSVSAPVMSRLGDIDHELGNEAARQVAQRFLAAPSLGLYDPILGRSIVEHLSAEQVGTTSQGSGATAMTAVGLAVGVAAAAAIII